MSERISPAVIANMASLQRNFATGANAIITKNERASVEWLRELGVVLRDSADLLEAAEARAVRAEQDTVRLDWLDSGPMSVVPAWGADGSRIGVVAQDGRKDGKTRRAGSVRAAIDAARSPGTRAPKRKARP